MYTEGTSVHIADVLLQVPDVLCATCVLIRAQN